MLFSFTIPTYNYADRLGNALDSILQQSTADDFEIIVIDDGSSDDTASMIKPYLSKYPNKVKYFYQENQGHAAARNYAAKKASGEYLFTLDADDRLTTNALQTMREAVKQHPNADLIIAGHISIAEDGSRKTKLKPKLSSNRSENFVNYLRKKFSIPHGAHLIRRSIFQKINYPTNILGREDIVFFAQVLANYNAVTINQAVLEIHKHATSFRHQLSKHNGNMEIVDTLFNPAIIPAKLMSYKKEYKSRLCLSFFRDHYLAGNYTKAREWYLQALRISPKRIFQWNYLNKFLRSMVAK